MPMHIYGFTLSHELHSAIQEAAWKNKTSSSALFREGMRKVIENKSLLQDWGTDPGNGSKPFRAKVHPEDWDEFKQAAWENKMSLAKAARIMLAHESGYKGGADDR